MSVTVESGKLYVSKYGPRAQFDQFDRLLVVDKQDLDYHQMEAEDKESDHEELLITDDEKDFGGSNVDTVKVKIHKSNIEVEDIKFLSFEIKTIEQTTIENQQKQNNNVLDGSENEEQELLLNEIQSINFDLDFSSSNSLVFDLPSHINKEGSNESDSIIEDDSVVRKAESGTDRKITEDNSTKEELDSKSNANSVTPDPIITFINNSDNENAVESITDINNNDISNNVVLEKDSIPEEIIESPEIENNENQITEDNQSGDEEGVGEDDPEALDAPIILDNPLAGTVEDDNINGTQLDDYISSIEGNDTVKGNEGNDVLVGGAGNDRAVYSGNQSDYVITRQLDGTIEVRDTVGSDGTDTLSQVEILEFGDATLSINNAVTNYKFSGTSDDYRFEAVGDGSYKVIDTGSSETITVPDNTTLEFSDVSYQISSGQIVGSSSNDNIIGQSTNDNIDGSGGNDTITGGGGNDSVHGDIGDDSLDGGEGADSIEGGSGHDTLRGGNGNDSIVGGNGSDIAVYGGNQSHYVITRQLDGTIEVNDTVGSDGTDTLSQVETLEFGDATLSTNNAVTNYKFSGTSDDYRFEAVGDGSYKVIDTGSGETITANDNTTLEFSDVSYKSVVDKL